VKFKNPHLLFFLALFYYPFVSAASFPQLVENCASIKLDQLYISSAQEAYEVVSLTMLDDAACEAYVDNLSNPGIFPWGPYSTARSTVYTHEIVDADLEVDGYDSMEIKPKSRVSVRNGDFNFSCDVEFPHSHLLAVTKRSKAIVKVVYSDAPFPQDKVFIFDLSQINTCPK